MSKTFNMNSGQFEEDGPDSNVVNPADPKTGNLGEVTANIVGPEDLKHPGRYLRGPDFMAQQVQLGAHVTVGVDEYVCKSDSTVYEAYWEKVTD